MSNKAAWMMTPKARPLVVADAPMPTAGPGEVVIRIHAVAINPVDVAVQLLGIFPVVTPYIGGCDLAGQIIEVGPEVDNFKVGDRVLGVPSAGFSAFQLYLATKANVIVKIPDSVSYAEASVFPLAMATAASALFQKDTHNLPLPRIGAEPQGKVVLVWGGSTSVGACAIQLLIGAGFDVAAVTSSRNLENLKALGAKYVFDYGKESVVEDVISGLKGVDFGGAFCTSREAEDVRKCGRIADALGGIKFVSTAMASTMPLVDGLPDGVGTSNVWGDTLFKNEVGPAVWGEWMPAALANGSLKIAPPPLMVGKGLEAIQDAIDRYVQGVSYQKVVVELD
ncbi:Zeta-crystallin [Dactylella cylindrospora]|nr:Zeta-crystallin [Dactylella cylindrospora]